MTRPQPSAGRIAAIRHVIDAETDPAAAPHTYAGMLRDLAAEIDRLAAERDGFCTQRDNLRNVVLFECDAIEAAARTSPPAASIAVHAATARVRAATHPRRWHPDSPRVAISITATATAGTEAAATVIEGAVR